MGKRVKVALWGHQNRLGTFELNATEGATVGLNLFWPDGTIVTEEELRSAVEAAGSSAVVIPAPGVVNPDPGILPAGSAIKLIKGTDGEIIVTHGDGTTGDPTISIHPNFTGGSGGVVTDWPVIKEYIGSAESFTVPVDFQMLVWDAFDVQGALTVDGSLIILGDQPDEPELISPNFTYNVGGQLTQIDYPAGEQKVFTYNGSGQLIQLDLIHDGITTRKTFTYVGSQLDYITQIDV